VGANVRVTNTGEVAGDEDFEPPSRFGYKYLCANWNLLNWEPDELIARYKTAGARIFLALANHLDSFDARD
jgi:alpha-L-fucosidase